VNTSTPITEMANCERRARQEDVDHHRDDDADQAHEQERAHAGQVALVV
jgi:hypothetical protein